ncbi:RNA-binding protein lark-like [Ischnura elegans]|uniref:RNA-binding protein lark-like n=1 Tax=Ischnura elegans TaxID=197161 RepID=UPI001ED8B3CC|nr:RNA-binding protein lark-like [Ischnura elegans]
MRQGRFLDRHHFQSRADRRTTHLTKISKMGDDIRTGSTPPKTKIFVGGLPEDAKAQDLRALFERYGTVTECDILNRYGFVHMKTDEMASRAIEALNNAEFMGVQISVEQSSSKKSGRGRGFGPMMRGRGGPMRGMRMGRAPPPYMMRDGRGDYDRRGPGMDGRGPGMDRIGLPPPPSMRNGYYDSYDRGYDGYYTART